MGRPSVRVLVIPGLHGSGPAHWQTWLQSRLPGAVRVEQDDWEHADLEAWSARIAGVLDQAPDLPHVAVAHSFGCLALAHCLGQRRQHPRRDDRPAGVQGALLVAPAEPERFHIADRLPHQGLDVPAMVFASETDPWMTLASARHWAAVWGANILNLGDVGHINTEAGFGPLPRALYLTQAFIHRIESSRRMSRVDLAELSFAV
jgi:hypothetical protein